MRVSLCSKRVTSKRSLRESGSPQISNIVGEQDCNVVLGDDDDVKWFQLTRCDRLKVDFDGRSKVHQYSRQQTLPVGDHAESPSAASYLIISTRRVIPLTYFARIL